MSELDVVYKVVSDSNKAHLNAVAAVTWVLYDIMLTFDQEITRVWKQKWLSLPFVIYILSRYYGLFFLAFSAAVMTNDNLTNDFCKGWGPFEGFGVQLLSMSVNALLAIRVHALYNQETLATALLIFLYAGETITEITISTLTGVESGATIAHPFGLPITGCLGTVSPRFGMVAWIVNIVYQSSLCGMAYIRLARDGHRSRLMVALVRDGAIFYFMIFFANFVNIILNHAIPASPIVEAGIPWLIGTFAIGTSRIILSLRGASSQQSFTSEFRAPHTTLAFAAADRNTECVALDTFDVTTSERHAAQSFKNTNAA